MNDLINRQAVIDEIMDLPNCHNGYSDTYDKTCIIGVIEGLPSVEPERKKGKWIPYLPEGLRYKCSECGSKYENPWHYCPNCGMYMRGKKALEIRR